MDSSALSQAIGNMLLGMAVAAFALGVSVTVGVGALVYWLVW